MWAATWAEGATSKRSLLGQTLLSFERRALGGPGYGGTGRLGDVGHCVN